MERRYVGELHSRRLRPDIVLEKRAPKYIIVEVETPPQGKNEKPGFVYTIGTDGGFTPKKLLHAALKGLATPTTPPVNEEGETVAINPGPAMPVAGQTQVLNPAYVTDHNTPKTQKYPQPCLSPRLQAHTPAVRERRPHALFLCSCDKSEQGVADSQKVVLVRLLRNVNRPVSPGLWIPSTDSCGKLSMTNSTSGHCSSFPPTSSSFKALSCDMVLGRAEICRYVSVVALVLQKY
jgi:hypothetical protein